MVRVTGSPPPPAALDGFTVGVTADRRADEQAALFERRGATVVHGPAIRTLPLGDDAALAAATESVIADPPRYLLANTGLGMRSWIGSAESQGHGEDLLAALRGARIHARGPKAAGAVQAAGLPVVATAPNARLRECVEQVLVDLRPGDRVAVQLDGGGRPPEIHALRDAGAAVLDVPVYRWEPADDVRPAQRLAEAVVAGRVHAVTFTSAPALRTWFDLACDVGIDADLRRCLASGEVVVGCVGPACKEAAEDAGLRGGDLVTPRLARLGPLVRAVAERLAHRTVAAGPLLISGTVVHVGDQRVELSDIEAQLLAVLADRAGAVVSKDDLLREVWRDPDGDPHVVEVAVARLRRRLGAAGTAVTTVVRRGYALR
jgi:uroporphyrinogen-III synthase